MPEKQVGNQKQEEKDDHGIEYPQKCPLTELPERLGEPRDDCSLGLDQHQSTNNSHRPESCDERIDLDLGNNKSVDHSDHCPAQYPYGNSSGSRVSVDESNACHITAEGECRTDRKIETARDDNKGHSNGNQPIGRNPRQNCPQVIDCQEAVRLPGLNSVKDHRRRQHAEENN